MHDIFWDLQLAVIVRSDRSANPKFALASTHIKPLLIILHHPTSADAQQFLRSAGLEEDSSNFKSSWASGGLEITRRLGPVTLTLVDLEQTSQMASDGGTPRSFLQ